MEQRSPENKHSHWVVPENEWHRAIDRPRHFRGAIPIRARITRTACRCNQHCAEMLLDGHARKHSRCRAFLGLLHTTDGLAIVGCSVCGAEAIERTIGARAGGSKCRWLVRFTRNSPYIIPDSNLDQFCQAPPPSSSPRHWNTPTVDRNFVLGGLDVFFLVL